MNPDVVIQVPRRHTVTITGPEAFRVVSAITSVYSHAARGGWVVSTQHLPAIRSYCQLHRLLLVEREQHDERTTTA